MAQLLELMQNSNQGESSTVTLMLPALRPDSHFERAGAKRVIGWSERATEKSSLFSAEPPALLLDALVKDAST